ncbi:MAG: hypothetical protein DWG76_08385 [Chloroflexi bacterium]|nr:hypothetical protein [Chloroflexota bacterium]
MSKSTLRSAIIVLTLITAVVHLVVLNLDFFTGGGKLDVLFALNGIGYLVLLWALLTDFPKGQSGLVHWAFMGFAAVTIVAWVMLNYLRGHGDALGYITKLDEVLLIAALWMHKE